MTTPAAVNPAGLSLDSPFPDEAHNFLLQQCRQLILMSAGLNTVASTATASVGSAAVIHARLQAQLDDLYRQLATAALAIADEAGRARNAEQTGTSTAATEQTARIAADQALATTVSATNVRIDATNINVATALANTDALQKRATTIEGNVSALTTQLANLTLTLATVNTRLTKLEARKLYTAFGMGSVTSLLGSGTNTVTVTLSTAMPDANYTAQVILLPATGINLASTAATVTAKTTTTVTVQIRNIGVSALSTVNFNVLAIEMV
jgi:hypothetical protein